MRILTVALAALLMHQTSFASPPRAQTDDGQHWQWSAGLLAGPTPADASRTLQDVKRYHDAHAVGNVFDNEIDTEGYFRSVHFRGVSPSHKGLSIGFVSVPTQKYSERIDYVGGETGDFQDGNISMLYGAGDVKTRAYRITNKRIPLSAVYLQSFGRLRIGGEAGVDIARGTVSYMEHFVRASDGSSSSHEYHADGAGYGFHLGGEADVRVGRGMELSVAIQYLQLTMTDFTGQGQSQGPLGPEKYDVAVVETRQRPGIELRSHYRDGGHELSYDASGVRLMMGLTMGWPW